MSPQPQTLSKGCVNCGKALAGQFCSGCGEEQLDVHKLTVRHFLTHSLHEIFEVDGKIWLTLRTLLRRPGVLTLEYCAGRRRRYVSPFRLLIIAAILYALATHGGLQVQMMLGPVDLSLAPAGVSEETSIAETVRRVDRLHLLRALLAEKQKAADLTSEAARQKFHGRMEKLAEPLSFANVLMLALALYVIFGRRRKLFVEHCVFSMNFMSFVLFTGSLFFPASYLLRHRWISGVLPFITLIVIWQFIYLVLAIRKFYSVPAATGVGSRLIEGFGAVAVYFLNSAFITGVQTFGAAVALWMAGSAV